ncbi:MAG: hypothetical protein ACFFCW_25785, partial [Candidatus Hodarchaeota archaeon]
SLTSLTSQLFKKISKDSVFAKSSPISYPYRDSDRNYTLCVMVDVDLGINSQKNVAVYLNLP